MKIRELTKAIRDAKDWTQREMAAELGLEQQDIQRLEAAGRNLEKQFRVFMKLLPVAFELDLITAHDLQEAAQYERQQDSGLNRKGKAGKI
jgi:transcriptional regulator with XRE-family HTH domain